MGEAGTGNELAERFATAIATRDTAGLAALLADDVDFTGMTPGRTWPATTPAEVVDVLLGHWFEVTDVVESMRWQANEPVGDTHHLSYRLEFTNADGERVAEDQAYFREQDGRIVWMRIMCSGFRARG